MSRLTKGVVEALALLGFFGAGVNGYFLSHLATSAAA
jgi:hypothetical protein